MQSYPLIGLDYQRNETTCEWVGNSATDAAKRAAEARSFIEVLSNDQSKRRGGGRANGTYYRKSLYKAPNYDEAMRRYGGVLSPLATSLEEQLNKTTETLIDTLRAEGCEISIVGTKMAIARPITMSDDRWQNGILPTIEANKSRIVGCLRREREVEDTRDSDTETEDPYRGRKRHDIVKSILPQMHDPFTKPDFIKRLIEANYAAFANDSKAVNNAFTWALQKGDLTSISRGIYRVPDHIRHRKKLDSIHATETQDPTQDQPPNSVTEEPVESAQEIITNSPSPIESIAKAYDEIRQGTSVEMPVAPSIDPLTALVTLCSQALAGEDDSEEFATEIEEAGRQFETDFLELVGNFTKTVVTKVAKRIRVESQARRVARALTQSVLVQADKDR